MGNYHLIERASTHITYWGQALMCVRCHSVANNCPGAGIAGKCEDNDGVKIKLSDHMTSHWTEIGYKPLEFLHTRKDEDDFVEDVDQKTKCLLQHTKRVNGESLIKT